MAVTGAVRHGHGRFTAAFGIGPKSKFFEVPFFAGQQNIYLENSGSLRAKLFVETGNHKEPHLHEKKSGVCCLQCIFIHPFKGERISNPGRT